jgi:hypothetical protein
MRSLIATREVFDGRDVTDLVEPNEVVGYGQVQCPICGAVRPAASPICCELAGEMASRELVSC